MILLHLGYFYCPGYICIVGTNTNTAFSCVVSAPDFDFTIVLLSHQNMLWLYDGTTIVVYTLYLQFDVYC